MRVREIIQNDGDSSLNSKAKSHQNVIKSLSDFILQFVVKEDRYYFMLL